MSIVKRRYWLGSEGPFLQVIDTEKPTPPFRFEAVEDAIERTTRGSIRGGATVIRGESGREETPLTTRRVGGRVTGVTEQDPITAEQYVAFRGAHANSFNEALIGVK